MSFRKVFLLSLLLAALLAVVVVPPALAVTSCTAGAAHVSGNVRVRTSEFTTARIMVVLHSGDSVTLTGVSRDGTLVGTSTLWCQVTISDGRTGYTHSSLLIAGAGSAVGGSAAPTATGTTVNGGTAVGDTATTTGQQNLVQPTNSSPVPTTAPSADAGVSFVCPRNCDGAVAMGLSPQQAATCPRLDRDHDGVACYGD